MDLAAAQDTAVAHFPALLTPEEVASVHAAAKKFHVTAALEARGDKVECVGVASLERNLYCPRRGTPRT
jgi:hypothetical protein